jgi:hypothetical protein
MVDLLNRVSADLQHCFEQWKINMQWWIGEIHGMGYKLICKILKINPIFHTSPIILWPYLLYENN